MRICGQILYEQSFRAILIFVQRKLGECCVNISMYFIAKIMQ